VSAKVLVTVGQQGFHGFFPRLLGKETSLRMLPGSKQDCRCLQILLGLPEPEDGALSR